MSRGPWTRLTKQYRAAERDLKRKEAWEKSKLKEKGFMSRAEAAALLHKKAVEIADGSVGEWVRVTLQIETQNVG